MKNKRADIKGQTRQGDVLVMAAELPFAMREIKEAGKDPAAFKEVKRDGGRVVLAYGEVTGHSHAISAPDVMLFADVDAILRSDRVNDRTGGAIVSDRVLRVKSEAPAPLCHEEHRTLELPAGDKVVRIQREYRRGPVPRSAAD